MVWHVSNLLQPHRPTGEKELIELAERAILLPHEIAFHPNPDALSWRINRLMA